MKIVSTTLVYTNWCISEFKLKIRNGIFFYKYKNINVKLYHYPKWGSYSIEGLSTYQEFMNGIEIIDHCENYINNIK